VTVWGGFERLGADKTVKQTLASGVYMSVPRHFSYESGGAGVYPGGGMSSTRAFTLRELLVVISAVARRTATKIAKSCNSEPRPVFGIRFAVYM
jgi:hypothetical protein